MNKKQYVALLTIPKMPSNKKNQEELIIWLRNVAKEIKKENYKVFATPCRFRLMK